MNGERVGLWSLGPRGRHELNYDAAWLDSVEARPLSLSLPLAPADFVYSGPVVEAYFDNLLPDNADIRARIRSRFSASSLAPFDLLAQVGRDCVGALQILRQDEEPASIRRIEGRALSPEEVENVLNGVTGASGGLPRELDFFRISIAGAQEKTALLWRDGRWWEPLGSTPTTHILKLPLGKIGTMNVDMSASIENEWLCSRIAAAFGLEVATCEIETFGSVKALVVERFDRRLSPDGSWLMRLPQEDLCQATGTPSHLKYESDGGPGILPIMRLLLGARDAFKDRKVFMKAQLLFWILAAPDGHAKNFSLFIEREGRYRLAPLYDIMSAHPVLGHGTNLIPPEKMKLAMALSGKNRHYEWAKIRLRHWRATADLCDFSGDLDAAIAEILEKAPGALKEVSASLPAGFPDSVASPILEGVAAAVTRLQNDVNTEA
jgi:serine/threonine-protein kinase HipA